MKTSYSNEFRESVRKTLAEVDRRLASGDLDGSGRFYTDQELSAGAATGKTRKPEEEAKAPAA